MYTVGKVPGMTDFLSASTRSRVMSAIRSKWSRIDREAHGDLKSAKIRHKMYPKLPGSPDILIYPDTVVFLDGCFWHSCPRCGRPPKSKLRYWGPKLAGNLSRDRRVSRFLRKQGWRVIRLWEHQIEADAAIVRLALRRRNSRRRRKGKRA